MEKNAKEHTSSMAALKCPRCNSSNTKFCYYNNYSLSQPRHFCKACKRYWTRGGTLRNVPIGGGCRKNKRLKKPTTSITTHPSSSSTSSALLSCHPPPPPPPPPPPSAPQVPSSSLPLISSNNNMDFSIHYANLPPLPAFLQQPQLDGFNLGYPSNAPTNHDQQQHLFDPLLGSSLSTATAASLLLSSIKQQQQQQQQTMMLSCDNLQSAHEDGNLGLGFVKQVKMEADHPHHHHHHHHAWMQAPCGNLFETMPAANTTVVDSPSANLFWSWNQSIGPLI